MVYQSLLRGESAVRLKAFVDFHSAGRACTKDRWEDELGRPLGPFDEYFGSSSVHDVCECNPVIFDLTEDQPP